MRRGIMTTTYLHPATRKRMDRIVKENCRYTLSRQLSDAIERGIALAQLEEQVGLKKITQRN